MTSYSSEMLSDFPNENYKLPHRVRSQICFDHQAIGRNGKGPKKSFLFLHQVYEAMKEQVFYGIEAYMARKKVEFNQLQPRFTYFRTRSSKAETLASWRFWRRTPTTSTRTRSKFDLVHPSSTSLKPYLSRPTQEPSYCVSLILSSKWLVMSVQS